MNIHPVLRAARIKTRRQFRQILRVIAVIVGLFGGFYVSVLLEEKEFEKAFYFFHIVLAAGLLEFIVADALADKSFPYDTERKLDLIEQRLGNQVIGVITERLAATIKKFEACDTSKILAAVHVLAELSDTTDQRFRRGLLQITNYIGANGEHKDVITKGRITLMNQGIIGRCARTETIECVDFADERDYQDSMVRDFGFTQSEAQRHTKGGRSYLAYPLRNGNYTIGVLYFFSTEPQVFPRATGTVAMSDVSNEIVNYVKFVGII